MTSSACRVLADRPTLQLGCPEFIEILAVRIDAEIHGGVRTSDEAR